MNQEQLPFMNNFKGSQRFRDFAQQLIGRKIVSWTCGYLNFGDDLVLIRQGDDMGEREGVMCVNPNYHDVFVDFTSYIPSTLPEGLQLFKSHVQGQKVVNVVYARIDEFQKNGPVIILENGYVIYVVESYEANNMGCFCALNSTDGLPLSAPWWRI